MKPDWKDAPEWAQWLAMDRNGDWWWYGQKPYKDERYGEWGPEDDDFATASTSSPDWHTSLEPRP